VDLADPAGPLGFAEIHVPADFPPPWAGRVIADRGGNSRAESAITAAPHKPACCAPGFAVPPALWTRIPGTGFRGHRSRGDPAPAARTAPGRPEPSWAA